MKPITKYCPECCETNEFRPYKLNSCGWSYRGYCHECTKKKERRRDRNAYMREYSRKRRSEREYQLRKSRIDYTELTDRVQVFLQENQPCTAYEMAKALGVNSRVIPGRLMALETSGTLIVNDCGLLSIFKKMSIDECIA